VHVAAVVFVVSVGSFPLMCVVLLLVFVGCCGVGDTCVVVVDTVGLVDVVVVIVYAFGVVAVTDVVTGVVYGDCDICGEFATSSSW